jgi:hypothetical protein
MEADTHGETAGHVGADEQQVAVEGEQSVGQVDEDMDDESDTDSYPCASEERVSVEGEQAGGLADYNMDSQSDNDEVQEQAIHEVYMDQQEGQQDRHVQEHGLRSGQMTVEPDVWMEDGMLGWGDVSVYNSSVEMLLC